MTDHTINWIAVEAAMRPIRARMALNVGETGHPFHHRTRNGAIIEGDPRISLDQLDYYWLAGVPVDVPTPWARPLPAIPVVVDWYNTAAGRRWWKQNRVPGQRSLWSD